MKSPMKNSIVGLLCGCLLALAAGGAQAAGQENFFAKTELQLHAELDREPVGDDILTATVEHYSEWTYGDNFFFLDIEGQPGSRTSADTLYFEYAPRLSLDRMVGHKIAPHELLGETYLTLQYNDSDRNFINRVWLAGVSFDFAFQPNFGYSNLSFLLRDEKTQDTGYQLTYAWGQPFNLAGQDLVFQGFADYWQNDATEVFLTEPQLRWQLSNLVGQSSVLSKAAIGTEVEISHDFFGNSYGWEVNPTLFFAMTF
jgi:nucleoside-specific outer membrane channel protein Tsx